MCGVCACICELFGTGMDSMFCLLACQWDWICDASHNCLYFYYLLLPRTLESKHHFGILFLVLSIFLYSSPDSAILIPASAKLTTPDKKFLQQLHLFPSSPTSKDKKCRTLTVTITASATPTTIHLMAMVTRMISSMVPGRI